MGGGHGWDGREKTPLNGAMGISPEIGSGFIKFVTRVKNLSWQFKDLGFVFSFQGKVCKCNEAAVVT